MYYIMGKLKLNSVNTKMYPFFLKIEGHFCLRISIKYCL